MLEQITLLLQSLYDIPAIVAWGGYTALFAIIFSETGLMVGFFLPGDSLLVTAGLLAAAGRLDILTLNIILIPAAIIGDSLGYYIGSRLGPRLYARNDSLLFKRKHLERAKAFYEKHGGKTIVLARFVPVVRTFAPAVAGAAAMPYRTFLGYNVMGGMLWVAGLLNISYFAGRVVPDLDKFLLPIIAIVIIVSFIPAIIELRTHPGRRRS